MIENKPLVWQMPHYDTPFPCFIDGCYEEARHLAKLRHGDIIVHVCLCDECLLESADVILQGLGNGDKLS